MNLANNCWTAVWLRGTQCRSHPSRISRDSEMADHLDEGRLGYGPAPTAPGIAQSPARQLGPAWTAWGWTASTSSTATGPTQDSAGGDDGCPRIPLSPGKALYAQGISSYSPAPNPARAAALGEISAPRC